MMAPANALDPVVPLYNLLDLKKVEDNNVAFALYEVVQVVKAHIPVPKQTSVSYKCFFTYLVLRYRCCLYNYFIVNMLFTNSFIYLFYTFHQLTDAMVSSL